MAAIKIDTSKTLGNIKPMHAVGQPPFTGGFLSFNFTHIRHLTNAKIPYSRLHDETAFSAEADSLIFPISSVISTPTLRTPRPTISRSPTSL